MAAIEVKDDCYYVPIVIHGKRNLDNFSITWADCLPLHFGTSGSVTIYPFPTEGKALYDLFRKELKLNWNPRFQFAKVNLFSEYFLQE